MQDKQLQDQQDTIRIPVIGENKAGSTTRTGQVYINCWPVTKKDPTTGEGSTRLTKRDGLTDVLDLFTTSGAAQRQDLHCVANVVITQLNDVYVCALYDITALKHYIIAYRPITGASTLVGTINATSQNDFVHLQEATLVNGGTLFAGVTVVWTKSDRTSSKCYWARGNGTTIAAATLTQIVAAGFPDQFGAPKVVCGPLLQMNGYFYVMCTDSSIYNSGGATATQNDATSWSASSIIFAYQYPDGGVGLMRYKHHIVAFGTNSVEFFNDVGGNPPSTRLQNTQQAFIKFGALNANVITNIDDNLYWLSYAISGGTGIWRLDGYTPTKLSTDHEDSILYAVLQSGTFSSAVKLFPYVTGNRKHLMIAGLGAGQDILARNMVANYFGNATDTYKTNWEYFALSPVLPNHLMYSLEDKVFWGLASMQYTSTQFVPVSAYPGYSNTGFYKQYVFMYNPSNSGSTSGARVFEVTRGTYVETNPDSTQNTTLPVLAAIQFNTLWLGNQKRKRINKVTAIFDEPPTTAAGDTNIYSTSLFYSTNPPAGASYSTVAAAQLAGLKERIIVYPQPTLRYYWNNLGSGRKWDFCIVSANKQDFPLVALELMVAQGSH